MSLSLTISKTNSQLRKKDASPFLDAALEFLFAIVEQEIHKKDPNYIGPSIHEFYTLSLRFSSLRQSSTRSTRRRNRISPSTALLKLLRFALGPKLAYFRSQRQVFLTCLKTVLLALLTYSEFLRCTNHNVQIADSIYSALAWYFSHYFFPVRRDTFLGILKHNVFEKREKIRQLYIPCKPSLQKVPQCLDGMQVYFQSHEFQEEIVPALFQCMK